MYKRYEAETLKAALQKVKMDLGSEAVILSQREIRKGGLTGMLGRKMWQIVAYCPATDDTRPAQKSPAGSERPSPSMPTARPPKSKVQQPVNHLIDEPALPFSELSSGLRRPAGPPEKKSGVYLQKPRASSYVPGAAATPRPPDAVSGAAIENSAFRVLLKELRSLSDRLNQPAPPAAPAEHVILPGVLPAFYQRLLMQDVPREIAVEMMSGLCDRPSLDLNDEGKTMEALEEHLASEIPAVSLDDLFSSRRPRVLFVAGPAGVGKTTTLAKIAALASRDEKMKIAFVTLDTFRVAAAEQLKTYADLIPADIEIVLSEEEFVTAVVKHTDKDMILVDTPGKNPCSPAALSDFSGYLKRLTTVKLPPPAVLLVLSAATKLGDLQRYASCYQSLTPAGIVFTKMDETGTYGPLLPVLASSKLPLVFLTCGQDVPEDIEPANPRRLARRIIGQ